MKKLLAVFGLLAMLSVLVVEPVAALTNGEQVTYTKSVTVPKESYTSYKDSFAADWNNIIDKEFVYGVARDAGKMYGFSVRGEGTNTSWLNCLDLETGVPCANYPIQFTGIEPISWHPVFTIDKTTHRAYIPAADPAGSNVNIVVQCVDLENPLTPDCGRTQLGMVPTNISDTNEPFVLGSKLFVLHSLQNATMPTANLFCFDVATQSVCPNQPFSFASGLIQGSNIPVIEKIGNRIYSNYGGKYSCWDSTINDECDGAWPINITWFDDIKLATPLPYVNEAGQIDGVCFRQSDQDGWDCFNKLGASVTTPTGLNAAIPAAAGQRCNVLEGSNRCNDIHYYRGEAVGKRVFTMTRFETVHLPAPIDFNETIEIKCFDFSTNSSCTGYPKALEGTYLSRVLYTESDSASCIWASGDQGPNQVQNFDAFTGGDCGEFGARVLANSFIEAGNDCAPTGYGKLTITSPTDYTTAKVTLLDATGSTLGIAQQDFNASHEVDLSSLNLPTSQGQLPQLLIELKDGNDDLIRVDIELSLSWDGTYQPACVVNGQEAVASGNGGGGNGGGENTSEEVTSESEVTINSGTLNVVKLTASFNKATWSITGGADKSKFRIANKDLLKFKTAPTPDDYVVKVKAKRKQKVATQTITVHVVDNSDPVVPGDEVKLGVVYFALDSWALDSAAMAKLDAYAKRIKKAGYQTVVLYGHTDNQGPAPRDVGLAKRRARQVYLYLSTTLKQVDFVREGFSRNKPAKPNTTDKNKSLNRRVEVWAK